MYGACRRFLMGQCRAVFQVRKSDLHIMKAGWEYKIYDHRLVLNLQIFMRIKISCQFERFMASQIGLTSFRGGGGIINFMTIKKGVVYVKN